MSFWEKIKSSLRSFMVGRNGPDELSFAILIFALVLLLVSSFFASWVLNLLGLASYVWIIFRIFSRNVEKRSAENQKYLQFRATFKTKCSQAFVRLKNCLLYTSLADAQRFSQTGQANLLRAFAQFPRRAAAHVLRAVAQPFDQSPRGGVGFRMHRGGVQHVL